MEEKKEEDPKELMRTRTESYKRREKAIMTVAIMTLVVGYAMFIVANLQADGYENMKSYDHLTDDGIAYRDLDNATFTWTSEELDKLHDDTYYVQWLGGSIIGIGLAILFAGMILIPSDKKTHKIQCDGSGEKKYCPECGLKLSRLEKE